MTKVSIKSSIPTKLSKVIDCRDIPIDHTNEVYKDRVLKLVRKMFNLNAKDTLKQYKDEYNKSEELLWNTIKEPNNTLGIVCIDGYSRAKDLNYPDDIGIVLNMGIPRLRARKFHTLDRIYAHIQMDGKSMLKLKFYNSSNDNNNDEPSFSYNNKKPGWHPHVSNASPCLGGYETRLQRFYKTKNALMYFKTLNQYMLTWNRRSPFWYLESGPEIKVTFNDGEVVPLSKFNNSMLQNYGEIKLETFKTFCKNYYDNIKSNKNITAYDKIDFLSIVFTVCQANLSFAKESVLPNVPQLSELNVIYSQWEAYQGSNSIGSIIDTARPILRMQGLRAINKDRPIKIKKTIKYMLSNHINAEERSYISRLKRIIQMTAQAGTRIYDDCTANKMYEEMIFDPDHVNRVIRMVNNYLIPLKIRIQNKSDELVMSKKVLSRPSFRSHLRFVYGGNPEALESLGKEWSWRYERVKRITNNMAKSKVNEENVVKYINEEIKKSFTLKMTKDRYLDWNSNPPKEKKRPAIDFDKSGMFWYGFRPLVEAGGKTELAIDLLKDKMPTNYDQYLQTYNNLVNNLYSIESNIVIQTLNKAKKEIIDGLQIKNTKESTQQVPLFFD